MSQPRVLVVDDRADNLVLLTSVLEPLPVEVVTASSGAEAIELLRESEFALVILDVQMPEMDGYETARRIKDRARTRLLPIIFLTAVSGAPEHHLEGYRSGAVDYVDRPFDPEVMRAKVSVFVELWARGEVIDAQRRSLAHQLAALDALNRELERSNALLDAFAGRAAEDLLEPLDDLAGFLELLRDRHAGSLGPSGGLLVERAIALADRQRARVTSMLEYTTAASATVDAATVALAAAVDEAIARTGERPVPAVRVVPGSLAEVCADRSHLVRILELLVGRAASAGATVVDVAAREEGPWSLVSVEDDGRAVGEAELAHLFSTGSADPSLSTVVCRRLVERHGGTIWAEGRGGAAGTTVRFTLPGDAGP